MCVPYSAAVPTRRPVHLIVVLFLSLVAADGATAQNFSAQLNPTGNPIGGGPRYSEIVAISAADFVVSNKAELFDALRSASRGQIVYVEDAAEIDLTGEHDIRIPSGVTLASGRGRGASEGALLYSNSKYDSDVPLLVTGGTNARITGLRLQGPDGSIGDHEYALVRYSNAIKADHAGLEVDNCEIWSWNKWGVWLRVSKDAYVHHNYIHHNRLNGYGYGVWIGGTDDGGGSIWSATIEANLFDFNRHSVGSSAHRISWEARHNIQLAHALDHDFDRHDSSLNEGGVKTDAHHNLFLKEGLNIMWDGVPAEHMRIANNWFVVQQSRAVDVRDAEPGGNLFLEDNRFEFNASDVLPVARATPSATEGRVPFTMTFDGSGSFDQEGGVITSYLWNFPADDGIGTRMRGTTAQYTFTEPGRYNVELMVRNDRGIPGTTLIPVIVRPATDRYLLSAWVKDNYIGTQSGFYEKQIVVNGTVAWRADAAGDDAWEHVLVDVTDQVSGLANAEIAFRLYASRAITDPENQIVELYMYVDDVHLFGGDVVNGDFEEGHKSWKMRQAGNWGTGTSSDEVRSGSEAYRMRKGYLARTNRGEYAEVYQAVPIVGFNGQVGGGAGTSDIVSYDLRHLNHDYTGKGVKVRRGTDGAEKGIGFAGSELDFAGLDNFASGAPVYLRTLYDQSLLGKDAAQDVVERQPRVVEGPNRKRSFSFSGAQGLNMPGLYRSIRGADQLTVIVAVKWSGHGSNFEQHIFTAGRYTPSAGQYPLSLYLDDTSYRLYGELKLSDESQIKLFDTTVLSAGTWHMVRLVFNASGKAELWVDGVLKDSETVAGGRSLLSVNPYDEGVFWGSNGGYDRGWRGELLPPQIYSRALSAYEAGFIEQELADYYNLKGALGAASLSQEINLRAGWNTISLHLIPNETKMSTLLKDVLGDVVMVQNGTGKVFYPEFGINDIGAWNILEAYEVHARAATTLKIEGSAFVARQTPIPLDAGWNLVPYLPNEYLEVEEALASIASELIMMVDEAGSVYYPEIGLNRIGKMAPGKGYNVYVSEATTLSYPGN